MPSSGFGMIAIGLSNTASGSVALPYNLAPLGAPGCHVYADPLFTTLVPTTGSGTASWATYFTTPLLFSQHLYSQAFGLDTAANALGITASNGIDTMLGGWQ
jgi:hypothetical protein